MAGPYYIQKYEEIIMSTDLTLLQGNCLKIMKEYKPHQFDAIVTDLPYGNNTYYGDTYVDNQENLAKLVKEFMPLALRVATRVIITCGTKNIYVYPKPTWVLSWATPAGTGRGPWGFCCWQPILAYGKDPYLSIGKGSRPDTIVFTGAAKKLGHPCPKPLDIMKWIVERTTLLGESILDPFMGAGTTLEAAYILNRHATGIELNESFFLEAQQQIKLAKDKPTMEQYLQYKEQSLL